MSDQGELVQLTVRVPPGIRSALKITAVRKGTTLQGLLTEVIEQQAADSVAELQAAQLPEVRAEVR